MNYMNPALKKSPRRLSTSVRLGVVAVAACFISAQVAANPLNPAVVNGTATFNQAGSVLTVTNSNGAIINWDKFSIQAGETTHFAQTAASSTVLNRVLNDPTAIYGTLSSNGQVWLVNPAGIMVGPGGRIDVAGFVASTLNISNADFLAGRHLFVNDGTARDVINQGEIRTPAGGSVYLIGSNVANESIITTPQGETILAAGATVSLIDSATPGVKVDITGATGNATNLGTITAEAGRIGIAGVIVRNSGTLNASSVVSEGGRIFLKASQDAYVDGNGRIVTTGTKGGSVEVLGNRVAVMDSAVIDASGTNGGGRILVGGDFQGKNPDIQNSQFTYFGPDATLKADATEVGDGGTVIVWADDTTRAYGSISARGGAAAGDGGFVETSGKNYLAVDGIRVDTRAPQGQTGNWLLDPSDLTITSVPGDTSINIYGGIFTTTGSPSTVYAGTIESNLSSSSITLQTDGGSGGAGNITATGVSISSSYGGSLTLAAYGGVAGATGNINITGSTINVNGGVTMLAGWDGVGFTSNDVSNGTGDISIVDSTIQSNSGDINLWAGRDLTLTGGATPTYIGSEYGGQTIDVQVGSNIFINGGAGGVSIGSLTASGGATSVNLAAGKDITVTGNTGGVWLGVGDLTGAYGGSSVTLLAGTDNGFSSNGYGGNIEMVGPGGTHIQTDANGSVSLTAFQVTAANGNITQNTSGTIYGGDVTFFAEGSATLNGSVTANTVSGSAGIYCPDGCYSSLYGGSLSFGSTSSVLALNDINLQSSRDITINGSMTSTSGTIDINAGLGYGYFGNYSSPFGGNVVIGGNISAGYNVNISANVGYDSHGNGNVTQNSGSSIVANGYNGINVSAGGSVSLNGMVSADYLSVRAGYQAAYFNGGYGVTPNGGNITVSGALSGYNGVQLIAEAGYSSGLNGNISQSAGSITSATGYVAIIGHGDVTLNGSVTAGNGGIFASAGLVDGGEGGYSSLYGGSLSFGNSSNIFALNDINLQSSRDITINGSMTSTSGNVNINAGQGYSGYFGPTFSSPFGGNVNIGGNISAGYNVNIAANVGFGTYGNGNITQNSGSSIVAGSDIYIDAGGSVSLGGTVSASSGYVSVNAGYQAGYFGSGYIFGVTPNGGDIKLGSQSVITGYSVGLTAYSGGSAAGNIVQDPGGVIAITGSLSGSDNFFRADGNLLLDGVVVASGFDPVSGMEGYAGYSGAPGMTLRISNITSPTGGNFYFQSTGDAVIGSIYAPTGYVGIYAGGAFYDNNGTALNITADTISLGSQFGGVAGGLAISMDTSVTSSLYGYVASGATFGGISIRNFGTSPSSVNLTDQASFQSSANFTQNGDLTVGYGGTAIAMEADSLALKSTGNMTIGSSGLSLTAAAYGSVLIGASGNLLLDGADIFPADYVDVGLAAGGSMTLTNGAYVHGENLLAVAGQELSLAYGSEIGAWQSALVAAGSGIRLEDSHIHSDYADVLMVTGGDIRVNDGSSISAGNSIYLTMNGGASTLYVNEFAGLSPSYIHALNPNTINIAFGARSSGGIVIDGVPTTTSTSGGSGFFVGSSMIPATAGAGLAIAYANTTVTVDPCVSNPDLCKPPSPITTPIYLAPEMPLPPDPNQFPDYPGYTVGGTEDSFGWEEEGGTKFDEAKDEKKDEKSARKKVGQCT